ncbi:MAG: methionine ABC transporter ATP-binding protein [Fastidiosipila sp.]|nr:methionine ABC transporter ATP-binding protein [Fastidiosipila sp.]
MLEVKNLSKSFPLEGDTLRAVDQVSFSVDEGEIYGLIGLSGAGKSTLVRCLNLLTRPDQGEIWFDGLNLVDQPEEVLRDKRREMGIIFQHFNLFMRKTVRDNVAYPLRLWGRSKTEIKARVDELLDYIGLSAHAKSYPAELSGGQKQRVAIARALALNPRLLLSDEATSALDPVNTELVVTMLRKVVDDLGIAVILITHQMEVAKVLCDRVAVMEEGRLVEENTVEQLFLQPREAATRRMVRGFDEDIPLERLASLTSAPVYRLGFRSESVRRPLISNLARQYELDVNILAGNINALVTGDIGYLVVSFDGDREKEETALEALKKEGVEILRLTNAQRGGLVS